MLFEMPKYHHPEFYKAGVCECARCKKSPLQSRMELHRNIITAHPCIRNNFKINGRWILAEESRMDSSVVLCDDGHLEVVENRNIKKGRSGDSGADGKM